MDGNLLFTKAQVWQERNEHNLLKDFEDEVPGYLQNNTLVDLLDSLSLESGIDFGAVSKNLIKCYEVLCDKGIVGSQEIQLVLAWIEDMQSLFI